ncbi:hypothetical protein D9756_004966 [Leucocoprinus leucothites]|uniref:Cullin N-terminal domain-containing protein n=1 Tax=Leucocoprinus leucothites TaxID=201217 RepID=A0A8H5G9N0_9AGAR|nr:hypothetical protein D9756_004966 [Leucoagaricus leucothites]
MSMPIPGSTADLATKWAYIEEGINQIMAKQEMSFTKYQALYTEAYNYCTTTVDSHKPTDCQADLYDHLERYLASHVKLIREKAISLEDEVTPEFYNTEWERYKAGANYMNRLFTFLNRHWVRRQRDENKKDIYPIYTLALVQWKLNMLDPIQDPQPNLASVVELQRNEVQQALE